jgi:hypothetical protein
MGIFDIFTGDPAKEAAEQNTARLNASKTSGMGYLDAGKTGALGALGTAAGTAGGLASKYGAGTDLYLDSLGVNGSAGNANAVNSFQAGPGFQYSVDQSTDALARRAASLGGAYSGNAMAAISDRAGNMANQQYGSWQDRLAGLISPEVSATGAQAGYQAAAAPVYTNDANSRVGLETGTTNGINTQATQAANAEMAGSGNLWNMGLNLAKLGVGAASGGTSLLGGLGK